MANEYASNFGDVVKHVVLGAAIENKRPVRYLESHGGRLDYDLAELTPGRGGVWDFLEVAAESPAFRASAYAKLLRPLVGTADAPGVYPGSVALADALLPKGAEVLAFDLDESSAVSVSEGLAASCPDTDAGLAICGILGANLAERTEADLTRLAFDLGHALQTKVGGLRFAVAQSHDEANPIWHPCGSRRASVGDVR